MPSWALVSNSGPFLIGKCSATELYTSANSFLKHKFHQITVCLTPSIDFLSLYCQNENLARRKSCMTWHLSVFLTLAGAHCRHNLMQSQCPFGILKRWSPYRLGILPVGFLQKLFPQDLCADLSLTAFSPDHVHEHFIQS